MQHLQISTPHFTIECLQLAGCSGIYFRQHHLNMMYLSINTELSHYIQHCVTPITLPSFRRSEQFRCLLVTVKAGVRYQFMFHFIYN